MKNALQKSFYTDMLVQASDQGQEGYIGRVVGLKHHRYLRLSKQDMLDGKRRYVPLLWVKSVKGNIVHLDKTATTVRKGWLDNAEVKTATKAASDAEKHDADQYPKKLRTERRH